jgi:hypothetical protein
MNYHILATDLDEFSIYGFDIYEPTRVDLFDDTFHVRVKADDKNGSGSNFEYGYEYEGSGSGFGSGYGVIYGDGFSKENETGEYPYEEFSWTLIRYLYS